MVSMKAAGRDREGRNDVRRTKLKGRKHWKSRSAVSEVIGSILILAITVVLFAGVMAFVYTMSGPPERVYTDLIGSIVLSPDGETVDEVRIINRGGQPLLDHRTDIYLTIGEEVRVLRISDSASPIGATTWGTGATWTYRLDDVDAGRTTEIAVAIKDTQADVVVWESRLNPDA